MTKSAKHPNRDAARLERAPTTELNDADLDRVSGGDTPISPRDAASGLPTGQRMHKPITT